MRNNWAEHQALGDHMDKLHQLARSTNAIFLTAAQANRTGDSFNRTAGIADDSTAIADSDRIQRYAEFVAILRTKNPIELALDEEISEEEANRRDILHDPTSFRYGTHMFTVIKSRHGGKNAEGHATWVRREGQNGQLILTRNYINFDINNFKVEERSDLRTILNNQLEQHELIDDDLL